jgi:hypothetical protein
MSRPTNTCLQNGPSGKHLPSGCHILIAEVFTFDAFRAIKLLLFREGNPGRNAQVDLFFLIAASVRPRYGTLRQQSANNDDMLRGTLFYDAPLSDE